MSKRKRSKPSANQEASPELAAALQAHAEEGAHTQQAENEIHKAAEVNAKLNRAFKAFGDVTTNCPDEQKADRFLDLGRAIVDAGIEGRIEKLTPGDAQRNFVVRLLRLACNQNREQLNHEVATFIAAGMKGDVHVRLWQIRKDLFPSPKQAHVTDGDGERIASDEELLQRIKTGLNRIERIVIGGEHDDATKLKGAALAAFKIIKRLNGRGISTKEILKALKKQGFEVKETTFYKHIVPQLKQHGVGNIKALGGYFIDGLSASAT